MRGNMKNLKHFNTTRGTYTSGNYSSFWLDDDFDFDRKTSIFDDEEVVKPKTDLIALSSYRRAIANFVNIVTQQDIPVTFKSSGDSYTDGKKVVISAKMDDKSFDPSVGLALHEGSHIKLSDFNFLKGLENSIPQEYIQLGESKGYSRWNVVSQIKNLLNYVEDRRIDYYVFSSSPGYKGYYHSMYDKYFHSKIVDKALGTDEYTEESLDSYMFRIINLTNKNSNLDALKGLREIYQTIDFKNISRLKDTEDAFKIACEIYGIVIKNLPKPKLDKDGNPVPQDSQSEEGSGTELSDEGFEKLLDSLENGTPMEDEESDSENSVGIDGVDGGGKPTDETPSDKIELSPAQKKQLQNAINKQNKFMEGEVTKKNVTKKEKQELQTIESSGMGYVEVGEGLDNYNGRNKTKCIVVRKLDKGLIDNGNISILSKWQGDRYDDNVESGYENDYIAEGANN